MLFSAVNAHGPWKYIAAAPENGRHLQQNDQIDQPVARAVLPVGLPEPRCKNVIFGNSIQYAVGSNHRGIDRSGQDQDADNHDEDVKADL
jgi:hypothetical protein